MAEEPLIIKGSNGTVFVYKNKTIISRSGFIGHFFKVLKEVEFKKPKLYANGYIQFITSAELATPKNTFWTSQNLWKDSNTVIFCSYKKKMVSYCIKLYDYIRDNIENYK